MKKAYEAVVLKRMKLWPAAMAFDVPVTTLLRKVKGITPMARKMGPPTILTSDEERLLVNWIMACAKKGMYLFPIKYLPIQKAST